MSIKKKILIPMIMLAIGCSSAVLISSVLLFSRDLTNASYASVGVSSAKVEHEIQNLISSANSAAIGISSNFDLTESLINGDREKMMLTAYNLRTIAKLDFFTIVDGEGTVLIRTHDPDNVGGSLAGLSNVKSALEGKIETYIVQGATVRLGVMSGAPMFDNDMNIIGAVSLGFRLDTQHFVNELKGVTGREIAFYLDDECISTTIMNADGVFAIGEKAAEEISNKVLNGEEYAEEIQISNGSAIVKYTPLYGAEGVVVGMLFVGEYTAENVNKIRAFAVNGAIMTPIVLAVCIIIALFIAGTIEKQINKARKAAETANKAKTVFLANMSHEIRTPMNSIMGFAELALDTPNNGLPLEIRDYLNKIKDSSKWLLNIIDDILDISKIESGKIELEKVPFDLREIISRCQSVTLPSIREKGLELRINIDHPTDKKLLGDPVRLYQALTNLLSNAVKFTNSGTIVFSSVVKNFEGNTAVIYFEVKDSGIGMSDEQIEKIFEPFIQADSSTTRTYGGTGLGLTITKNIVELIGGKLSVESSLGSGSTFSFEIELETVDATDEISDSQNFVFLEKPRFEGLILICDDNPMNQEVICGHLSHIGLETVVAENGKIGVEMVSRRIENGEKPFSMIFMDIFMPIMDGMEAASKISALNTGIPIVAMTANIMNSEVEQYKARGMADCLGKPFTSQALWRILFKYLTPVDNVQIQEYKQVQHDNELQNKLRINFIKINQTKFAEITDAISAGDIKLAHRLAHTLKGNAGQVGKIQLQSIAAEIENMLNNGATEIPEKNMSRLRAELEQALREFRPLLDEELAARSGYPPLNNKQTLALFEKLELMLENINPECVNLLDEIRSVPGTEKLERYIENYDFYSALTALLNLKKELGLNTD